MNPLFLLLRVIYWGVLAYLPFLLQDQYVDFTLWAVGHPKAECLKTGVPFMTNVQLFCWALMLLLWPLVAWNMGGKFLWGRFKLRKQESTASGLKNT